MEETVGCVQFGFMKRMRTRNATFMLKMVTKRAVEMQKHIFICFVNFEKALDRERHELLIAYLE